MQPAGIVSGTAAAAAIVSGNGWPLAGGALAFTSCIVLLRSQGAVYAALAPFGETLDWAAEEGGSVADHVNGLIHRIGNPRPGFAGLPDERPAIMGIVNATPDSFSDGGEFLDADKAVTHGLALAEAGADIIDVGGESTRPGAQAVAPADEIARVVPVVRGLAERGIRVSIDTRHAEVMAAALDVGAAVINDVAALTGEGAVEVAAAKRVPVVLMHMVGDPRTMQQAPEYDCAALDVYDYLAARVAACVAAGIPPERICVDPGIGFGKTVLHNVQVMARLGLYHGLGCPVLLGVSRKSFIARLSQEEPPKDRLPGSLAAALAGLDQGVQIVRVHDVAETAQAIAVWRAMRDAG